MSNQNPQALYKSVLDLKITFSAPGISQPIILNEGNGLAQVIELDATPSVEWERTTTGDVSIAGLPSKGTGRVFLHPGGLAVAQLASVVDSYNLVGPIPGVITVSSASAGFSYQLTMVTLTDPFKGFGASKTIDDYSYAFAFVPPRGALLAQMLNAAAGLINQV